MLSDVTPMMSHDTRIMVLLYVAMRQGVTILPYDLMFKGVRVLQVARMILLLDDTMR